MGQGREVCRDQRLPSITSRSADAPDDRCGSKPGLPPWGPHVRFHRLQTCPRGQSVGQAAQFCLAERCTEFRLAIIRADRCSDSVIRWPWMPTKTREPGRLGQVGPVGNTWLHEPPRGIMHVRYGGISGSDRRVVRTPRMTLNRPAYTLRCACSPIATTYTVVMFWTLPRSLPGRNMIDLDSFWSFPNSAVNLR